MEQSNISKDAYEVGDAVWFTIPDNVSGPASLYYPGEVIEYHPKGNVLTLTPVSITSEDVHFGKQFTVENNANYVRRRGVDNNDTESGVMDLIGLNDLSEQSVVWNLRQRYKKGNIYTYIGSILLSVNPYKMYDIYGLPVVKKYEGRVLGDLPPHLFSVASSCYTRLQKSGQPQVLVISGESGSGKTECTKLILGYLALVNKSPSNLITEQILESNPLLESFGNAKTLKNDNSSRFGKYIQIYFEMGSSSLSITGSKISEYLLEKSRITTQNSGERNYHIFYELLEGLSKEQKDKYGLLTPDKYFYLNQGGEVTISGKSDKDDFEALLSAMQILGMSSGEIDTVFKLLAAVLHLGNVYFHRKAMKHGQEGVEIGSDAEIQWIGHLLEIPPEFIKKALTTRTTEARGEKVVSPLTIDQSLDSRDAIAKIIYSNLFTWLVQRVNRIVFKGETDTAINVLDIFGFENFKENTYEQLLINYGNEQLHGLTQRCLFKLEQAEYEKEKLEWTSIAVEDNMSVINLLVKKPVGVLHLLDDESNFPKGTDTSFLEKCHYNHALDENYLRSRVNLNEFGVRHYAGSVWYNVDGFIEKNRDFLRADVKYVLANSKDKLISKILSLAPHHQKQGRGGAGGGGTTRFITMKPRAPTVSARFTDNLNNLMESMSRCAPWFVRCFKPNEGKRAGIFDVDLMLEQIRYSGILELTRMRKHGYPIRLEFAQFASRYRILSKKQNLGSLTARDTCRLILTSAGGQDFQLGSTKVFLRESLEQRLEKLRYEIYSKSARTIQSSVRGYLARKQYRNLVSAAIVLQSYWRMQLERKKFDTVRRGVTKLQAIVRMKRDLRRYRILKDLSNKKHSSQNGGQLSKAQSNIRIPINHLEIPAELAFVLSNVDDDEYAVTCEKIKMSEKLSVRSFESGLSFKEYVREYIKTDFIEKKEPILSPFLKNSSRNATQVFKLILRYVNDVNLTGLRDLLLLAYIANYGINDENLRDEIVVQIMNQINVNERADYLLAGCLSVFGVSEELRDYIYSDLSEICKVKIGQDKYGNRKLPPAGVELKTCGPKAPAQIFVEVDNFLTRVESWSGVSEIADRVGSKLGMSDGGFTLEIPDGEGEVEIGSYLFDCNGFFGRYKVFNRSEHVLFPQRGQQFGSAQQKSKSLDSVHGLSSSKLNERYYAVEERAIVDSSSSKVAYGEIGGSIVGGGLRQGPPRYIKKKKYSKFSSALSDTSEAPSLASHVRRVRVPSQAEDVDQFLDDLFSPVTDNLDDLSDVRSLVSNLKGGHVNVIDSVIEKRRATDFIQSAMEQNLQIQQQLIAQNEALQRLLDEPKSVIPPAPPMPEDIFLEGHRPFMDPYGRAKTVRIGKWRWPPKESDPEYEEYRNSLNKQELIQEGHGSSSPPQPTHHNHNHNNHYHQQQQQQHQQQMQEKAVHPIVKVQRPFGDSAVGKLKLSENLRMKLEQVTSVRGPKQAGRVVQDLSRNNNMMSSGPDVNDGVKKIDNKRRMELAEKLGGGGGMTTRTVQPMQPRDHMFNQPPPLPPSNNGIGGGGVGGNPVDDFYDDLSQVYNQVTHANTHNNMGGGKGGDLSWKEVDLQFRLRKDLVMDGDDEGFLLRQIQRDVNDSNCWRILRREREHLQSLRTKVNVVEVAKKWAFYFWRFFKADTNSRKGSHVGQSATSVQWLAVNETGLKSVYINEDGELASDEFTPWAKVAAVIVKRGVVTLTLGNGQKTSYTLKNNNYGAFRKTIDLFYKSERALLASPVQRGSPPGRDSVVQQPPQYHHQQHHHMGHNPNNGVIGGGREVDPTFGLVRGRFLREEGGGGGGGGGGVVGGGRKVSSVSGHSYTSSTMSNVHSSSQHSQLVMEAPSEIGTKRVDRDSHHHHQAHHQGRVEMEERSEESLKDDGKHSLLQFAMAYYRKDKFNLSEEKADWTWREQMKLVKYSPKPLESSLIPFENEGLEKLALECYASLLKYMEPSVEGEVEAVYTILRNCHLSSPPPGVDGLDIPALNLPDEVYCHLMKQTTNNSNTRSCQRCWRLFTIIAAYFTCSDILKPYLFKYLESNAYDKRRAFHGTALVTLQNLRKTFKYGGRRNVPSVEEITAISAGRNAKRQIFRLPGGSQKIVNVKIASVVEDIIDELSESLNIPSTSSEKTEFSIYCIVEGDTFTMPLQREEYILDVTTELQKNQQVYYLIFCRSVWFFPMRLESDVYVEVVFNQIAPDYLEGLLLVMPGQTIPQDVVYDIGRIASLLHRAADLSAPPTLKETKYLLPKPALAARDMRPAQWVSLVNKYWEEDSLQLVPPHEAKTTVLEILSKWPLFGSSFFSVKRIQDPTPPEEYIMALNKHGVHFLDIVTHETLNAWTYNEIISTRKVKNEDGLLYLDLKVGNLMQQRITRLQTEHAHEISRLIRQYIHIQKIH